MWPGSTAELDGGVQVWGCALASPLALRPGAPERHPLGWGLFPALGGGSELFTTFCRCSRLDVLLTLGSQHSVSTCYVQVWLRGGSC